MNQSEISKIAKACKIADSILNKTIKKIKKNSFKTEKDVANFLKKETYKSNCKLAFLPIVAMGKNAFTLHHRPTDTKLKKGFLVIDFGVRYKGYNSDCTRTLYLGKPTNKEKGLYNLVLLAQETALMHALPGVYAFDVDAIGRAILWPYFRHFIHSIGHGVGKRIHQSPIVGPGGKKTLKKNQAITIEPGLYFKNKLGIRIEDTILIKEKPLILTKVTKKLVIIDGYT